MGIRYAPEIDGLRAIAVLAVVLYHAFEQPAAGLVGVDIFFVISGYLITAILRREYEATGAIDFRAFYERRVRRLLPALGVVMAVVLIAFPLPGVRESALAASVFGANFYFQNAPDEGLRPLAHLWSLSVEEQFYMAWPLLLLASMRGGRAVWCVALLTFAGLLLAQDFVNVDRRAAFYQMPARFWELSAGALIVFLPRLRAWPRVGLALVAVALTWRLRDFPGLGAMPAVLGSALLLHAVHTGAPLGMVGNLLRSRPMAWTGLISYSLYLWHWPLLAYDNLAPSHWPVRLGLVALAFVMAWASYRFVETRFRVASSRAVTAET